MGQERRETLVGEQFAAAHSRSHWKSCQRGGNSLIALCPVLKVRASSPAVPSFAPIQSSFRYQQTSLVSVRADRAWGRAPTSQPLQSFEQRPSCGDEEETIHRKESGNQTAGASRDAPTIVREVLHSPSQPLDAATRTFMESRFGYDFSGVRVHADAKAAESARAVNALAYTMGGSIVFDAGQYEPRTIAGKHLLAHELTHVIQQEKGKRGIGPGLFSEERIQLRAREKETNKPECERRPTSLRDEQLKTCVQEIYDSQGETSRAFQAFGKELIRRVIAEARTLPEFEVQARINQHSAELIRQSLNSGAFQVASIYVSVYERENARLLKQARLAFPTRQVKQSRQPVPREVRSGHNRCLNTFYYYLQSFYSQAELEAIPETEEISKILMVRDVVTNLQRRHPQGVPQKDIIDALAGRGINQERVIQILAITKQMKILEMVRPGRWRATGDVGQGLLTKTMESLRRAGLTDEKVDLKTPKSKYHGSEDEQERSASDDLANQLLTYIRNWIMPVRSGEYFFALSLHRDWHSVTLRAEIQPNGRMQLFWLDQEGQRERSTRKSLAEEIWAFWPTEYWPAYSTLWPLIPNPASKEQ